MKTGLSTKTLGRWEYARQYARIYNQAHPKQWRTPRRRWTGLSRKLMGEAAYVAAWREKRKAKAEASA